MEDNRIIELFFERSEKAIAALAEKYGRACFKVAYNILNNHEDSEEVVSDSYLGAWNSIPPQKPKPLSSYILTLVRNHALNRLDYNKALKRQSNFAMYIDEMGFDIASNESPEKSLEAKQLGLMINEFLGTLSAANRILFIRKYFYFDTFEDLAEMTGEKAGTLKVRMMRIRNDLKEYLKEKGVAV